MLKKLEILLQREIDPAFAKRAAFIFETVEAVKPKKILDIGCGRGFYVQALALYQFPTDIYGIDANEAYLAKARKQISDRRVHISQGDIYALSYKDNTFDLIICSEIFEHLTDDAAALAEVRRVLKPGGSLLLTVPDEHFPFLWDPLNWVLMRFLHTHVPKHIWWLAGMWADHEKLYTQQKLVATVKKQKFRVQKVAHVVHYCWPLSHFLLYGIGKNLVERFGFSSFNRFDFTQKNNGSILARIVGFPSRFDKQTHGSYVNLCLYAVKE